MRRALYFEWRALQAAVLLISISVLAFSISQLAPGSFLDELKLNPEVSSTTLDGLRVQYGLDQPVAIRYFKWAKSLVRGDLGYSLSYHVAVNRLIWPRAENTLLLGTAAMLLSWMLALFFGFISARHSGTWLDRCFSWSASALLATPELVLALLFICIAARFSEPTHVSLDSGAQQAHAGSILKELVVPCLALAFAGFPLLFRHVRAAVRKAWSAPCVSAARGHGIGNFRLLVFHVLPLASNPLISLFGLSLATLISGSFMVEVVTGWPGLGPLFLDAIYARDAHVVMSIVMLFSLLLVGSNFVADLLLYACDPRVRAEA